MGLFKEATRESLFLRLGLVGPAGSGKTMSALRVGKGLAGPGGSMAVIDTERDSAKLYARGHGLKFSHTGLKTYGVEKFISAIKEAEEDGFDVLVIDSLSHAWSGKDGILEFVDKAGKRSGGAGNFGAWRDATPRHNSLVDAILDAKLHVIITMRSKVEYVVEKVGDKTQVRKVGLQPIQRDGLEYEFTIVGDMNQDHELVVTKTRASFLKDQVIKEPDEEFGRQLAAWLADGEPVEVSPPPPAAAPLDSRIVEIGEFPDHIKDVCRNVMRTAMDSGISRSDAIDQAVEQGRKLLAVDDAVEAGAE